VLNGPILNAGGRLSIMPRFEAELAIDMLKQSQPTHLFLLSAMWVALTARPEFAKLRFPEVRYVQTAASPLSAHQQATIREVFPNAEFGWGFGMTETCVTTVKNRYTEEILSHPGSIGYVWRHVETRLVDEHGGVVSTGGPGAGELQVRGPTVFAGYWRDLKATNEAFTADGWLRTGDLLRLDEDGFAYFIGRSKDMIKSGGENVSALEVEQCLLEHRSVHEAAVYGVPSDRWGEEVRAAVVLTPGHEFDPAALIEFCKSRIAAFKVPKRIDAVAELPKSASGKIQKFRLQELVP
jgi:fatty-acyl-CoA synthase